MRYDEIKWLLTMLETLKKVDFITGRQIISNKRFQDAIGEAVKIIEKSIEIDEKDIKIIMDFSIEASKIAKKETWQNKIKLMAEILDMKWREVESAVSKKLK